MFTGGETDFNFLVFILWRWVLPFFSFKNFLFYFCNFRSVLNLNPYMFTGSRIFLDLMAEFWFCNNISFSHVRFSLWQCETSSAILFPFTRVLFSFDHSMWDNSSLIQMWELISYLYGTGLLMVIVTHIWLWR